VIIVFSAGEGIRGLILGQIKSFGTDIIEVEIKVPSTKKGHASEQESATSLVAGVQITSLCLDDLEDINKLENVQDSYAGVMSQEQVNYANETKKAFLLGTNASYIDIDKAEIKEGRFFSDLDDKSLAKVVVLGSKISEELFGDTNPIGKLIKIKNTKFLVIGTIKERGAVMTMDFDDFAYVPIRTLQKRLMGIDHILYSVHRLINLDLAEETAREIRSILRFNHDIPVPNEPDDTRKDDFRVVTMSEMMSMLDTITGALTILLLSIVAVSLVVGGVGVMNVMYLIVSERTPEIGLRKAVGARFRDIMIQFLAESVLVTIIAGFVGIILGLAFSYLLALGASYYGFDWRFIVPFRAFVVAFLFSVFFGIFFGIFPARKAARLEAVEALRKE